MTSDLVVAIADPVTVARAVLLTFTTVTADLGQRVADEMPARDASPRWPAIRITDLGTRRPSRHQVRALLQLDCWAATQKGADALARAVIAEAEAVRELVVAGVVVTGFADLVARSLPDETLKPAQPRSVVTGHVWFHPASP